MAQQAVVDTQPHWAAGVYSDVDYDDITEVFMDPMGAHAFVRQYFAAHKLTVIENKPHPNSSKMQVWVENFTPEQIAGLPPMVLPNGGEVRFTVKAPAPSAQPTPGLGYWCCAPFLFCYVCACFK